MCIGSWLIRRLIVITLVSTFCYSNLPRCRADENEYLWALEVPFSDKFLAISPEKVVDACTKLLETKKDLTREEIIAALHQRAWALQFLGREKEACKDYDKLLEMTPSDPQIRWESVLARASQMDRDSYISQLKIIAKDNPSFARAYGALAIAYFHKRDISSALENANDALKLDKSNLSALEARAKAHFVQEDYEASLTALNTLLGVSPAPRYTAFEEYYLMRGIVLVHLGRFEEGISNFHMARRLNSSYESADYWLCLAYQLNGKHRLANQLALELQKRNPKSLRPAGLICSHLNSQRKYEETLSKGAAAAKVGLDSALIRYEVGFANYALGNYTSAIENLEKSPMIPGACLLKAYLLSTCPLKAIRHGKAARDELEKWADVIPDSDPFVKMIRGAAYAESGDYERAVDLLEECLKDKRADADLIKECKDQLTYYRQESAFESKGPPKARVPLQFAEGYAGYLKPFDPGYRITIELFLMAP